jgi:hypothetical protein
MYFLRVVEHGPVRFWAVTPVMPNASGIAGVRFFESADLPLIS